jgi:LPXTG-motif cell wall-anchored protein
VKQSTLTRRLAAGAVALMVGAAGAIAMAAPAAAYGQPSKQIPFKHAEVAGVAECDPETGDWTVTWTVTNKAFLQATINSLSNEAVDGLELGQLIPGPANYEWGQVVGTEVLPDGTESAELEVELKWAWEHKYFKHGQKKSKWFDHYVTTSDIVELGNCKDEPELPEEPEVPEEPEPVVPPIGLTVVTCDLAAFMVDNTEGTAEAVLTLTPNQAANHGPASGFSYTLDEEGFAEVEVEENATITEVLGEADSDNPVELVYAPGDGLETYAFEAASGLVIDIALTLDGEAIELETTQLVWDEDSAELECEAEGEGGELPVTGMSTGLMALGAVLLLAVGGGLFLVARRRRVSFTA